MEVELKPAEVSSSSRKGFGSYIREDLLILEDFLAAFPPLAPDRCLSGAGVSPFPPFLLGLCLRYLVVDLTPSTRADSSRTQIYPLFVSSVGDNFSTFLKACPAFSNHLKKSTKVCQHTPFIDKLCRMLFCHPLDDGSLALSVFFSNHS